MMRITLLIGIFIFSGCVPKQFSHEAIPAWQIARSNTKAHLRGLDLCDDGTIWASGAQGTVLKSLDTGKTWTTFQIPNCEELDFRDIEGFDKNNACTMSSGNGVRFYHTNDGGLHWILTYEDTTHTVFFDGMDFNDRRGMAYGDPQGGKFTVLGSLDSGKTWAVANRSGMPNALEGEGGFAASGTGIVLGKSCVWMAASGAHISRIFRASADSHWTTHTAPLLSATSSGIFSMAFADDQRGMAVGGDYLDSTRNIGNAAYTNDGGLNWYSSKSNPNGYRSCVAFSADGEFAVATGRSGTDYSTDGGVHWLPISDIGYFSCIILDEYLIAIGRSGRIGKLALRTL